MLSEQVLVFFLYFAWFAGPFIAVEYVKDRKMAQGRYVQLILAGCGAILIVSAALFFVTHHLGG